MHAGKPTGGIRESGQAKRGAQPQSTGRPPSRPGRHGGGDMAGEAARSGRRARKKRRAGMWLPARKGVRPACCRSRGSVPQRQVRPGRFHIARRPVASTPLCAVARSLHRLAGAGAARVRPRVPEGSFPEKRPGRERSSHALSSFPSGSWALYDPFSEKSGGVFTSAE